MHIFSHLSKRTMVLYGLVILLALFFFITLTNRFLYPSRAGLEYVSVFWDVANVEDIKEGEEIPLNVFMATSKEVSGATIVINYNPENLTFIQKESGYVDEVCQANDYAFDDMPKVVNDEEKGQVSITRWKLTDASDLKKELFCWGTVVFTLKPGATDGDISFSSDTSGWEIVGPSGVQFEPRLYEDEVVHFSKSATSITSIPQEPTPTPGGEFTCTHDSECPSLPPNCSSNGCSVNKCINNGCVAVFEPFVTPTPTTSQPQECSTDNDCPQILCATEPCPTGTLCEAECYDYPHKCVNNTCVRLVAVPTDAPKPESCTFHEDCSAVMCEIPPCGTQMCRGGQCVFEPYPSCKSKLDCNYPKEGCYNGKCLDLTTVITPTPSKKPTVLPTQRPTSTPLPTSSPINTSHLEFNPSIIQTQTNSTFVYDIILDTGGQGILGTDAIITYDATKLEFVGVQAGSLPLDVMNSQREGTVYVTGIVKLDNDAYVGRGVLATITMKSISSGTSLLDFDCVEGKTTDSNIASDSINADDIIECSSNNTLKVIASSTQTGSCQENLPGDANCSGGCDMVDFEIFRREKLNLIVTTTSDADGNGVVDLVDFNIWRNCYLQ